MHKIILIVMLVVTSCVLPQWGGGEKYPELLPNQKALQILKSMKFGIFMHWGPSAIRGTSSWARGNHPYEFAPRIPIQEYDSLYKEFNPVLFDAEDWISTVKASGAKYYIITTKHHDGFCNWESKFTEYDIMSTPYKKDVLKELSEECYKQDILFGTYYSICDWSHIDYPGRYGGDPRPVESSNMDRYIIYMKNQLDELIEKYKTNILWFDGYWEEPWTHEMGMDLYKYLRGKKNNLLINNRVDRKRASRDGKINSDKYAGDYMTPEQKVGEFEINHMWESCITISDGWFFKPQGRLKSLKELINILVQTVGGGGNLLLNVGPMPDGRIEMFQKKRLKELGYWLRENGESIYETEGGPFIPSESISSTRKKNRIFIHVLDWVEDTLLVPKFNNKLQKTYILNGNNFKYNSLGKYLSISIPEERRKKLNTILVFEIEGNASEIEVLPAIEFKNVKNIKLSVKPDEKYKANGVKTLIDNKIGSDNIYENWLGFEGSSVEATIDLKIVKDISNLKIGFYQNQGNWIFLPKEVELKVSQDGIKFFRAEIKHTEIQKSNVNKRFEVSFWPSEIRARYIKVKAINVGRCPDWHKGAGGKAWLFMDEIKINK